MQATTPPIGTCVLCLVTFFACLWLLHILRGPPVSSNPRRRSQPTMCPETEWANEPRCFPPSMMEGFTQGEGEVEVEVEGKPSDNPTTGPRLVEQTDVDFSDILLPAEDRDTSERLKRDVDQVQSINDRFDAAKRRPTENRLRPGIYNQAQRRQIVETLLRRPVCSRHVRSWRTENSDYLRGDVIPKTTDGWGVLKLGRHNPTMDLHPGALGPMSGMEGKWLSVGNVPSNLFDDESGVPR